jgi:hypothetical protein
MLPLCSLDRAVNVAPIHRIHLLNQRHPGCASPADVVALLHTVEAVAWCDEEWHPECAT